MSVGEIMTYSKKEIEKYFYSIDNLPTLPVIAMQLFSLIEEEASMKKIAKVISSDPSLTTKVLKISNSAFYGVRKKIDTLERALVILGINEINNIVHGISFFKLFPQKNILNRFDMVKFWEHSLMVAHTARILARKLDIRTHGEEYTSGLIHDIGKLIISQYFQKEFKQIINSSY